jgi:hypothetical protein
MGREDRTAFRFTHEHPSVIDSPYEAATPLGSPWASLKRPRLSKNLGPQRWVRRQGQAAVLSREHPDDEPEGQLFHDEEGPPRGTARRIPK